MELTDVVRGARQHVTDSAGLFAVCTPLGAFLENVLAGMSDETSFKSRVMVGGLYLGGLGGILGYFRDRSRQLLHITGGTREGYQQIHDMAYMAAATAVVNPLIYMGAGARDAKEVALATLLAVGTALAAGGIMGYSVDLFRDLTGYEPTNRIPKMIQERPSLMKKMMVAGILAASVGIAELIYAITPN